MATTKVVANVVTTVTTKVVAVETTVVETTVVEATVVRKKINSYLDYNKNLLKKQI
ncbi:hypothetical protein SPHINGO8BC_50263 [Sphingobacterium multivorum]|uniref:Uncharacterized protein n=1 Tax=Sphingobacterium multivorum TaxID=28454 RepID=A0A654BP10_SPHMU|nr:hypothetical protein SPHINGO8BC_50263 [Sphingobacterium multivorum]